jgi:hypothetical protein
VLLWLLAGNVVPLGGIVFAGWKLHTILVVYWLESGVTGAIFTAKVLQCTGNDDAAALPSFPKVDGGQPATSLVGRPNQGVARVFLKQYGSFWLGHGFFVLSYPVVFAVEFASPSTVVVASVGLVTSHLASYQRNFIGRQEYAHTGPVTLMIEPYRRVFVLHATVVLGAIAITVIGSPAGAVAIMIGLKTLFDLFGHWSEHNRARQRMSTGTAADIES